MRLFILALSGACMILYGYALAGYGAYTFGRGRPDYVIWGLTAGTACAVAAILLWKKWLKDTTPDLLIFEVDGVLIDTNGSPGISGDWKELGLPTAIYTKRTRGEMITVYQTLNWRDFPDDMLICADDGILKPSPEGLAVLCERSGAKYPVFFGGTAVDREEWTAFGKGDFIAIGPILETESRRENFLHFDTLEEALSSLLPSQK